MADYAFLTAWRVAAEREAVFEVLHESERWPEWWDGLERVVKLEDGDADGRGSLGLYTWRSVMRYRLEFEMRITRVERPYRMDGAATGELAGIGIWRLYEDDGGDRRAVRVARAHDPLVDERARAARAARLQVEPRPAHARRRPRARPAPRRRASQRRLELLVRQRVGSSTTSAARRSTSTNTHHARVALVVVDARAEVAVLEPIGVGGLDVALDLVRRLGRRRSPRRARRCARGPRSRRRSAAGCRARRRSARASSSAEQHRRGAVLQHLRPAPTAGRRCPRSACSRCASRLPSQGATAPIRKRLQNEDEDQRRDEVDAAADGRQLVQDHRVEQGQDRIGGPHPGTAQAPAQPPRPRDARSAPPPKRTIQGDAGALGRQRGTPALRGRSGAPGARARAPAGRGDPRHAAASSSTTRSTRRAGAPSPGTSRWARTGTACRASRSRRPTAAGR